MNGDLFISFLGIFIGVFLVDMLFITRPKILELTGQKKQKKKKKNKNKKEKQLGELEYLCTKFKLNKEKLNYKELTYMIPLINSLIIALVATIIELIDIPLLFKLIIGFILLLGLIYALYEIYGRHLKKKEN